jgi:hypothetical protein
MGWPATAADLASRTYASRVNDDAEIAELWARAAVTLPPGWRLDSLQCASTGIAPDQRSDDWTAVAVSSNEREVRVTDSTPIAAIERLAAEINQRPAVADGPARGT